MDGDATVILKRTVDAGAPDAADAGTKPIEIPRQLGAVRLVRQIGQGGMGVVWLGRHELLNRDVAVKFLLNLVADENDPGFESLLEGARAAAALRHEGLNGVLNADVVDRVPFLVMEYVDGPTVAQVCQRFGKTSLAVARVLLAASCEAVAELHDQDVIHRDIKPSNILLTRDARPVLTDFGLACWRSAQALGTTVDGVAGTPAYMAPEMFERTVSPRSDVYALGVMAFELLIGTVPFDGSLAEMERAHREDALPEEAVAQLPPSLAQVIERAMHKNPMFRYKTARHLLRAFDDAFGELDQIEVSRARGQLELSTLISRTQLNGGDDDSADPRAGLGGTYYDRLGTLVSSRKRNPEESDPSGEDLIERVKEDRACLRCGGSIRGEPLTGRCPNCLLLIKLTIEPGSAPASAAGSSKGWAPPESRNAAADGTGRAAGIPADSASTPPVVTSTGKETWRAALRRLWNELLGK